MIKTFSRSIFRSFFGRLLKKLKLAQKTLPKNIDLQDKKEFIFFKLNGQACESVYLNLCQNNSFLFNIDVPELKLWNICELKNKIYLKNIDGKIIGEIFIKKGSITMSLYNEEYVLGENYYTINDSFYLSLKNSLKELSKDNEKKTTQIGLSSVCDFFSEEVSSNNAIYYYNKSGPLERKPATPLSCIVGDSTEQTDKWTRIFQSTKDGIPSPDIYLLFLKNAYILNGSLVFTSKKHLIECTRQLGSTLGPYTSFIKKNQSFHKLENESVPNIRFEEAISLDRNKTYFLYGNCHTGFGHHLGQATPSSYFINNLLDLHPSLQNNLVAISRGGISYESFRKELFELSLDKQVECLSLTSGLVRVKNLIIPSTLENYGNHWFALKKLWNSIREKAMKRSTLRNVDFSKYNGIYLSRGGYSRNCINSDEFSRLMTKYRMFQFSPPESLSMIDQIALMSHFKVFIAPYGSGACNILFSMDESHLISNLCSHSDGQVWDYSNCQMMGSDYTYIFSNPINPSASFHERRYKFSTEVYESILQKIALTGDL